MSAKVLVVALDACDATTARALAARGRMPTLRRLLGSWATSAVENPYGLFVGTLWTTFFTACDPTETKFYCWEEIDPQTYERRLTSPSNLHGEPFWNRLSAAGRRVAVLDVPHSRAATLLNGIQISEWGCHDRHDGFHTQPPELAGEIASRYGFHPILGVDPFEPKEFAPDDYVHRAGPHRTPAEERALRDGLLVGIEAKEALSLEYLAGGDWDLFLTVFGDSHSIGHQAWYLHDPTHPRHDPVLAAELGDPIEQVYARLDLALEAHLAMAGADATVVVVLSHGMGPHYDGTHLLAEVLTRLDRAHAGGGPAGTTVMRQAKLAWARLPRPMQRRLGPLVMAPLQRRLRRHPPPRSPEQNTADQRRAQRYYPNPNNFVFGGIRLNLAGREPNGLVQAGADFDAVCDELRDHLRAVINVDTGGPLVGDVIRTDEHYRRRPDDNLPDLFIDWNRQSLVETVWSPTIGVVHVPYTHWRTGDHRPDGLLLAAGPGLEPGTAYPRMRMMDLGPSLAARLGVGLDGVDGRPAAWFSGPVPVGSAGVEG
jgi:predicted AlkP superfamily phosphohydrolase/phosphomutase